VTDENKARKAAEARLNAQSGFKKMLGGFVILWVIVVAVWALSGGGSFWPVWVFLGTGIALLYGAWSAYGPRDRGPTETEIDAETKKFEGQD
jgi:uncharacterized membrane protein